jgi:hypothetical protein
VKLVDIDMELSKARDKNDETIKKKKEKAEKEYQQA